MQPQAPAELPSFGLGCKMLDQRNARYGQRDRQRQQ